MDKPSVSIYKLFLSQGKEALVDGDDFNRLNKNKWTYDYKGYAFRRKNGVTEFMHRVILGLKGGDGKIVDHINQNGLDNRKSNLRVCSQSVNIRNSRWSARLKNKASKYIGVSFNKNKGLYFSQLRLNGRRLWGGYHKTEVGAWDSYKKLLKKEK